MRLGVTSFLTDRSMGPADFARAAEERGFHSLYLPEHTHMPVIESSPATVVEGVRGEEYRRSLDPFVALSAAAASTSSIRIGTGVCLVAEHDPITLAKQVATLDLLSSGRFVFGIGYGWNSEELAHHGVPFPERRDVAHEHLRCMQSLWRDDVAEFRGDRVEMGPSFAWPKPVQKPWPPVLFGGGAGPKLFAAIAALAAGWMPIGGSGVGKALPDLRRAFEEEGREMGEVVPFGTIPGEGKLEHYRSLGINEVVLRIPSGPPDVMVPVLDGYAPFLDFASKL
ncbi:MAG TPA: TIGR03619 family F420-dependent LLM class oxidoreductase [Acidimicrobiales bacterium]|nr:TIGR03619 family F420-dependent LLM class oxidoreductase [Acidimicrobiales bacterium]